MLAIWLHFCIFYCVTLIFDLILMGEVSWLTIRVLSLWTDRHTQTVSQMPPFSRDCHWC